MNRNYRLILGMLVLVFGTLWAGNHSANPLPEDRGLAGALAALEKLPVYVRVLHTTAHPDDESSGTLTWLSRKYHAQTALFCLTRGEGGQNILGNEKYDDLGLVRTGELLEACRYYGAELYFGSNLDFGFSKSAEETLSKWGHAAALEEMVRFIRWWRPTIILSRFRGDAGDGHGHHQAAGLLVKEAFRAAGDPLQFPAHFERGLHAWQARKLYGSMRPDEASMPREETSSVVSVPVGDYDPVLGRTYQEIATEGYSKHRTQGMGNAFALPFRDFEYFKLAAPLDGNASSKNSFFDSIDTSLPAIWELAGEEKQTIAFLREDLRGIQQSAEEALTVFQAAAPEKSAAAAAWGAGLLEEALKKIEASSLSKPAKGFVTKALNEKLQDFRNAVHAVLGIRLVAQTTTPAAVPGEEEGLQLYLFNQNAEKIETSRVRIASSKDRPDLVWSTFQLEHKQVAKGDTAAARLQFKVRPEESLTEPFWFLNKSTDGRYRLLPTRNEFAPFGPPEISVEVGYLFNGIEIPIQTHAVAQAGDPVRGADFVDFQVVPALSVTLSPEINISPINPGKRIHELQASVINNRNNRAKGELKLLTPEGWQAKPERMKFDLSRQGEAFTAKFTLEEAPGAKAGSYTIKAVAFLDGQEFRRGYKTISYPDNWTRNHYRIAEARMERFDVKVAPGLSIGYIPGAGDEIPSALERLGIKPRILSAEDLAFGDLNHYSAIVTGIRAYNVNEDLRTHNRRLLDYVADGGTLIVQYVRPSEGRGLSPFSYAPYPMAGGGTDRITVEDSPLKMLDPNHPVFSRPNKITEDDFRGWVQERGLYFMKEWDPRYTALLSGNDPGEEPQPGGMLYTHYGKGHYIYTGYAWFRQLPAGIPGAYRIFANMISLGKINLQTGF
jgi:LmbE family N-acetylglucosaminyl deacetylase